jgi:hypothetical protein
MSPRPDLKLVEGGKQPDHRCPEDMLGFLFTREAQLQRELAEVRQALAEQRVRYSNAHQLRIFVSVDCLRRRFGPERER